MLRALAQVRARARVRAQLERAPLGQARTLEPVQARGAQEVQGLPQQALLLVPVPPQAQVAGRAHLGQMLERPQPAAPSTLRQGFFF